MNVSSSFNTALPTSGPLKEQAAVASTSSNGVTGEDDFDIMLKHVDFPQLLSLAGEVERQRKTIQEHTGNKYSSQQELPKSHLGVDVTLQTIHTLQQYLCSSFPVGSVPRGDYPVTDSMVDDAISLLRQELGDMQKSHPVKKGKQTSIAVKYAKEQTDILMRWMIDNRSNPFPDPSALAWLQEVTGLSQQQVINWTTNVRKRNKKATLSGKKPHHFIDFLFLVQDRDQKRESMPQATVSCNDDMDVVPSEKPGVKRQRQAISTSSTTPEQEPLDFLTDLPSHEDVLEDFATEWFDDVPSLADEMFPEDLDEEHTNDDERYPKRSRSSSFDLESMEEDLATWANQFGLTL